MFSITQYLHTVTWLLTIKMVPLWVIYGPKDRLWTFVMLTWACTQDFTSLPTPQGFHRGAATWLAASMSVTFGNMKQLLCYIECILSAHMHMNFAWNEVYTEKCCIDMVQVYVSVTARLYHSNQLGLLCKGRLFICGWHVECDSLAKYSSCLAYPG